MTVAELARQEGISEPTLYTWRNKDKSEGRAVPGRKSTEEQWPAEGKPATVIETPARYEAELSQYCREKGLYPDQVKQWKPASLQGFQRGAGRDKAIRQQTR